MRMHKMHLHHNYMQTHLLQAHVNSFLDMTLDDDELATWRAFLTAHAHLTRRISRELAEAGLPDLGWYDLLWALYRRPERRLRVNELARDVVLSPTAMSRFVDRVEAAGCVRREPDPADRRALQVVITPEGIRLLRRMWPVYERAIEHHFAAFLGRSGPRVRTMLQRMADSAREGPAGDPTKA
jgi:DNA-binding MarR family transcriptional regulator